MKRRTRQLALAALGGAFLVTACNMEKKLIVQCQAPASAGQQSFTDNVYPLFSSVNRCGQCHVPGNQAPALGDPNSALSAYLAARPYLDRLDAPALSSLHIQLSNHHCQQTGCDDRDGTITKAIGLWAQAELTSPAGQAACGPTPVPVTKTLWSPVGTVGVDQVTTTVTAGGSQSYLVYDLTAVGGKGVKIVFQFAKYTSGSYLISNPTLISANKLHIDGMHLILQNGDQTTDYPMWDDESVDANASSTFPGSRIDSRFAIVLPGGATGDKFQLLIRNIGLPTGVTALTMGPGQKITFDGDIKPIIQTYCFPCHSPTGGAGAAGKDWTSYSILTTQSFTTTLRDGSTASGISVVPGNPSASWLYTTAADGNPKVMPPPGTPAMSGLALLTLKAWIESGAPEQ